MKWPRLSLRRVSHAAVVLTSVVSATVIAVGAPHQVGAADLSAVTCDPVEGSESSTVPSLDSYQPMLAERIIDTRNDIGGVGDALGAGCTLIVDTNSIQPNGAVGVALSVTVVSPSTGFFTAFPCEQGLPGTSSVNARPGLPTANLVVVTPDTAGRICIFSSDGGDVIVDVSGWWSNDVSRPSSSGGDRFAPVDPVRADDTRIANDAIKRPAGDVRPIEVAGDLVPDDATAVAVNLAAVNPSTGGYLVVYPCGAEPPLASNVNFAAGEKRAVGAIVEVGDEGKICVTGNAETHYIVDVTGYYAPSSAFGPSVALTPVDDTRVVDTRRTDVAGFRFAAGTTQTFDLARPVRGPDDTVATVLNVVATQADQPGFVTVFPCGGTRPTTSSLNYGVGQTANLVVTALSPDTEICVYTSTAVEVVIDLVGSFAGTDGSLANQISLSSGSGFVAVDQEFEVAGSDYTTHCGTSGLRGDLRLGLAPGASARVNGRAVTELDTAVSIPVDGLLTIDLRRGGERAAYHLRCVPMDFPLYNTTRSGNAPGWYMTEIGWNVPGNGRFLAILDGRGVPVWYKRTARKPANGREEKLIDFKLLSTGNFVASPITGQGFGIDPDDGHRIFDLDGDLIDVRLAIDPNPGDDIPFPSDHHDYVEIEGSGSVAGRSIVVYPLVKNQDLSELATVDRFTGDIIDPRCNYGENPSNRWIVDGVIQEILPNGSTWEWSTFEHFGYDEITYAQCFPGNYPEEPGGGEIDAYHINSLQRVNEPGCEPECDYIVSARHLDAVYRVDRSTENIDWILSSLPSDPGADGYVENKSGAPRLKILNDPQGGPLRMHDARFIGNLLTMYDNRSGTGEPSRIVAYRIDPVNLTATRVSQFDHPEDRTSPQLGSLRSTPDNTLMVGWGTTQPVFAEYTTDGRELLRIELPSNDAAFRINKYSPATFDADELRATAGGFIESP